MTELSGTELSGAELSGTELSGTELSGTGTPGTGRAGTGRLDPAHPSLDDLADLAEDLLDPDRTTRVQAHLDGCLTCRQTSAALSSVTATLAAVPAPPMPAAVANRLQSVVAAESARRQAAAAVPVPGSVPVRTLTPRRPVTLGHFGAERRRTPGWRRWVPVLAAAAAAAAVGFGGYVVSATAGLNEPPVVAAAISTDDLAAQAAGLEQSRDLDPHRFSNAWFCARSVTRGRITGLAGARVDGLPALLVYTRSGGADLVTVVTGCGALGPTAIASAPIPR